MYVQVFSETPHPYPTYPSCSLSQRGCSHIEKGEGSEIGLRHSPHGQRRLIKSHSFDYPGLRYHFHIIGHGVVGGRAVKGWQSKFTRVFNEMYWTVLCIS